MTKHEEYYYRDLVYQSSALSGCTEGSSYSYFIYARQFWNHFNKDPLQINDDDIAGYFYWLLRIKKVSPATITVSKRAIQYLYKGLKSNRPALNSIRAPKVRKHPELLSQKEISLLISKITSPVFRMFLKLLQGTGLRLSEGRNLQIGDIDKDRLILKVQRGKGGKARIVPLPSSVYGQLRSYWDMQRPPKPWLFSNTNTGNPYVSRSFQRAFNHARKSCDFNDGVTIHTLRHSYATSLLESGVDLSVLQKLLGHYSISSTVIYLHLSTRTFEDARKAINGLFNHEN